MNFLLTISIGTPAAHYLFAYMPLLIPDRVSGRLIGTMEPICQMDAMNIAVSSCSDHPRSSSFLIICESSGCSVKDSTLFSFIRVYLMKTVHPSNFVCSACVCIPRAHAIGPQKNGLDRAQHVNEIFG